METSQKRPLDTEPEAGSSRSIYSNWRAKLRNKAGAVAALAAAIIALSPGAGRADDTGVWSAVKPAGLVPIHMSLLPDGHLVLFDQFSKFRLMDPVAETLVAMPMPWYASFCGSNCLLADGRLFVAGGGGGEPKLAIEAAGVYNPITSSWFFPPPMNAKRWYSTSITLPTGNVLVSAGAGPLVPMQEYRVDTNIWRTTPDLVGTGYLYPRLFVAPNGLVFNAGPDDETSYMDISDDGNEEEVAENNYGYRIKGSAVMYDTGKILIVGGATTGTAAATETCEIIDLNQPNPTWQYTGSMHFPRKDMTLVIQPNGKVLATGGVSGPNADNPVYPVEEWDPATGQWTILASISVIRGYHSTSLLIPDGRIVSAGASKESYQIFTPGYLSKGPRPTITSGPDVVTLGVNFDVATPDAADIQQVNLIRCGATTHAVNFDQRILRLPFTVGGGVLHVTAPTSPNVAVPGYYMLFILNGNGVPSVAKMVRITPADLAAPADFRARALSARRVKLNWTDMSLLETKYVVERQLVENGVAQPAVSFDVLNNTMGYMDKSIESGKLYRYSVKAVGAGGTLSSQTVDVQVPVLTSPGQPTNVRAVPGVKAGTIVFSWRDADDLETQFIVERSLDKVSWSIAATLPENTTSFLDQGLTGGTKYIYRVTAHNAAGSSLPSGQVGAIAPSTDVEQQVSGLVLSPTAVQGGIMSHGTLTLNIPADPGGTVVALASDTPEATVPASVTVPEGQTSVKFDIETTPVSVQVLAKITATLGLARSATLAVKPPTLSALSLAKSSVVSGFAVSGKVTLSAPAPEAGMQVTLSSDRPEATVPSSVVIGPGETTGLFQVQTSVVPNDISAKITASAGGVTKTLALSILRHSVSGITLAPVTVTGGTSTVATVTINAPAAPGGDVVSLSSDNASATVPATVTVPEGLNSVKVTVTTTAVGTQTAVHISATMGVTKSATLTIKTPAVASVTASPNPVKGGLTSTGTVTLNGPAPAGGMVVTLASNQSAASVPASVTVPEGAKTMTFQITTQPVVANVLAGITASAGGLTKSVTLTVKP